jgi:uncharacterized HAD superfamily protein
MKKLLKIAVDFDGTLCEYAFPEIGEQNNQHKKLMNLLIDLRKQGHKIILWTNRGDNEQYPVLTQAIEWCKERGLEFDAVNENLPGQKKLSGPSPKIMADYYIDDKVLEFGSVESQLRTLNIVSKL